MITTDLNFETFAREAQTYIDQLAQELGHPDEKKRVLKIWRAVMHTIRDRIHLGESFDIIAPLPMILKGIYVEGWKYKEKPPLTYTTLEEMKSSVKALQSHYGERSFPWKKSTEQIISDTLNSLQRYLPKEQLNHIKNQMPKEIKEYMDGKVEN
ncbi:DUF2267 domain-containing protein [Sinomicrobium pectinilyticum]|uniref:DUF2267 domain-containing protein n=1 Tax=Sinomicrobium pectinilyticum TaxID=1084421 RepID=A0A3N0EH86_SINP1|nr:DUF2267 domain-containing protein [Sinomicrobium pectinilyticum]RNL87246.1 DUF2267 domain-containing protein [Sinomicrobium pectinilyticum]